MGEGREDSDPESVRGSEGIHQSVTVKGTRSPLTGLRVICGREREGVVLSHRKGNSSEEFSSGNFRDFSVGPDGAEPR